MLLNNNSPVSGTEVGNVVRRTSRNNNKDKKDKGSGGGTSAVRNSWSFATELPVVVPPVKENIYADPETLFNNANETAKAVSRSRLRQRSQSNLNSSSVAGIRAARDHSSNNRHQNGGTISAKGVDYIRIHPGQQQQQPQRQVPVITDHIQDRSEYGSPDGSSAHSTAEREADAKKAATDLFDVYEVINQNQSNDYKVTNHLIQPEHPTKQEPAPMVRSGSGRSSAATTNSTPTARGSPREVHHGRKSTAASTPTTTGPNAVKTEWTFLPSPSGPTPPPIEQPLHIHNREINSKPEESSMVRKGLLWVMRDRIFSRYHERFCILTRNYLHCFKKGTEQSLTQMGTFLFKVSLAEVVAVQWLDKKGTAIVCLQLAKDERLLVKTSMDLNGWFDDLQNCVKETIGRRQTLLSDQRTKQETFTSPVQVQTRSRQQQAQQQQPVMRDRSLAARHRTNNRFSLMSDHEVKLTTGPALESPENGNSTGIMPTEPLSLVYNVVPAQMTRSPSAPQQQQQAVQQQRQTVAPVPVPYRERSVSFDRSRVSKAEREAKRRSYYPSNHVTQV